MDKINDLAAAITIGSKGSGQCFTTLRDPHGNTCAIGAAMAGVGLKPDYKNWEPFLNRFSQQLQALPTHCPACKARFLRYRSSLFDHGPDLIAHLNDHHKWSRPQIAFWLSTLFPPKKLVDQPPITGVKVSPVEASCP